MNTSIPVNNRVSNSKTYSTTYFRKLLELCLVVTLLLSVGFLASCKKLSSPSGSPPSAVTGLNAASGISNATISWVNPINAGYADDGVTPLELKRISVIYTKSNSQTINTLGAAVETITLAANQTNVVIYNLAPATDYLYTVVVVNSIEEAATSDIEQFRTFAAAPPTAPANLTVTARSATELDVSFTAGSGAASHTVKWKVSTASSYGTPQTANGTSHTITGLTAGTTYDVVVAAVNARGTTEAAAAQGTTSAAAVAAPGAPTGVSVVAKANSTTELDVSFTAGSGAASHTVRWKVSTASSYSAPVTVTGNSHTISGLTAGTTYDVVVAAVNAGGTTEAAAVQGTTSAAAPVAAPGAPTGVSVTGRSATELDVSFTAGSGAASHTVKWKVSTASSYGTPQTANGTSHTITGLTAGTTYDVVVAAVNTGGTTEATAAQGTTSAAAPVAAPGAPTGVSVTGRSATELDVSFTAGSGAATHTVKWRIAAGGTYNAPQTVTGTSHTITSLTAGTTYDVVVAAVNARGTTEAAAVQGTTSAAAPGAPGAPTGVSLTPFFSTTFDVKFTAGTGATSHTVRWRAEDGTYNTAVTVTSPYIISNLTANTKYEVEVTAVNSAGSISTSVQGTTYATPTSDAEFPSVVTLTGVSSTSIEVMFTAGQYATSHKILFTDNGNVRNIERVASPYFITGLTANTEYQVEIVAQNSRGETRSPGSQQPVRTKP